MVHNSLSVLMLPGKSAPPDQRAMTATIWAKPMMRDARLQAGTRPASMMLPGMLPALLMLPQVHYGQSLMSRTVSWIYARQAGVPHLLRASWFTTQGKILPAGL